MEVKKNNWTYDSVKKIALKYKTRSEFMKGNSKAYIYARRHKMLDEICSHMTPNIRVFWSEEKVKKEALKYTKKEFKDKYKNTAYKWAINHKVLYKLVYKKERL